MGRESPNAFVTLTENHLSPDLRVFLGERKKKKGSGKTQLLSRLYEKGRRGAKTEETKPVKKREKKLEPDPQKIPPDGNGKGGDFTKKHKLEKKRHYLFLEVRGDTK